jgi:hypothetical protein
MPARFSELSDESLFAYYESVRRQAAADVQLRGEFRLVSEATRQYAADLQKEMELRRLRFVPIDWK